MIKFLLENSKKILLISVLIGALTILGNVINKLIKWEYLTIFFKVIKQGFYLFDFVIDINQLLLALGSLFLLLIAYWGFKATNLVIKNLR